MVADGQPARAIATVTEPAPSRSSEVSAIARLAEADRRGEPAARAERTPFLRQVRMASSHVGRYERLDLRAIRFDNDRWWLIPR